MTSATRRSRAPISPDTGGGDGKIPVIGRVFPAPVAAKVPEIIFLFWVVKILTTAGGEVTSDYLKKYGNFGGGGTEVAPGKWIPPARNSPSVTGCLPARRSRSSIRSCWVSPSAIDQTFVSRGR